MNNILSIKQICSECNACQQICSKGAIKMVEAEEGFSYPTVNEQICADCGLCIKVCPMINAENVKLQTGKVFAAQLKNTEILGKSSSGGIFSLIANYVLQKDGVVFGAAWDDNLQLHHIGVETQHELPKLRGSKYVHSDIGNTYKEAREYLKQGRWVYFSGTPCQIAGLRLFLHKDYPTLITSDLVCHGTPSQKLFNMFVMQMEKEQGVQVVDYQFRDKRVFGWSCSSSSTTRNINTGKTKYHFYDKNMVAYFQAFIKGHITREDCYQCPFACPQRVSDITLADYWDVSLQHPEMPNQSDGVSMVIINTNKGKGIFESEKKKIVLIESTIEKAMATSNHNLKAPTQRPAERDGVYERAFSDFLSFRDLYASYGRPENYYKRVYRNNRIKRVPILRTLLKLIGKA